jgi:hypothetical protein
VVKWLLRWDPSKGKLFTWFTKCSKHAFLSELVKANGDRKRFHSTSDNLERFIGAEDHAIDKLDLETELTQKLQDLTCRWGHPQEIGCLQYLFKCILDEDNRDKQAAIRAASYAYCVTLDMAKFFYRWAVSELRGLYMERIRVKLTADDLIYLSESYSVFVDLVDMFGIEAGKKMVAKYGGSRCKIPTLNYLCRLHENYDIWQEIENTDKDPESIAIVAARHKKTARSAAEAYEEMCEILNPKRAGEYYIFRENDDD